MLENINNESGPAMKKSEKTVKNFPMRLASHVSKIAKVWFPINAFSPGSQVHWQRRILSLS